MKEVTAIHLMKKPLHTELNNPIENKKAYDLLSRVEYFEPLEFLTPEVYLVEGVDFIALVNKENESIDYQIDLKNIKINGIDALYQSSLWRDVASKYTKGTKGYTSLSGYVFYHYLLPRSNLLLVSDKEQTNNGQSFWFNRLNDAFNKNLHVYVIKDSQIIGEIPNYSEMLKMKNEIWGKGKYHIRLAISSLNFDVPKISAPKI